MSQVMTREDCPWVMSQKKRMETIKGKVTVAASL